MKLVLRNISNDFIKSISFKTFEQNEGFIDELVSIKTSASACLMSANEKINSCELAKLKLTLEKLNIFFSYSIQIIEKPSLVERL